jgi:NADPH:quinone reductase-like Zn-dependent oxidoreductase
MSRQVRGALVSAFVKQRLMLFLAKERATDFEHLTRLVEAGQLVSTLQRAFPLDQARDAMQLLERGEIRGKVAITI